MDQDNAILQERAIRLARPLEIQDPGEMLEVVSFSVGSENYIIETTLIKEIAKLREYTPVPGTADFVVGITNIRGVVLAIFDLSRLFGVQTKGLIDLTRIIVLGEDNMEFGILAEKVEQSHSLPVAAILPVPENIRSSSARYLKGVTASAALVLDAQILLNDEKLFIDQ